MVTVLHTEAFEDQLMVCRLPDEGDNQDSIAKCSRSEQGLASNSVVVTDWWNHSFHAISAKWQAARCNVRSTRSKYIQLVLLTADRTA